MFSNRLLNRTAHIVTAIPICIAFRDSVATVSCVEDSSMEPTLHGRGPESSGRDGSDYVLVEKLSTKILPLRRGDAICLRSPDDPKKELFSRIIGLSGDWVRMPGRDAPERVKEGHCWIEGDNTAMTVRAGMPWPGSVPLALVQGRATHVVWPPLRVGRIDRNPTLQRVVTVSSTKGSVVIVQTDQMGAIHRKERAQSPSGG